jgi:hypothetical protein
LLIVDVELVPQICSVVTVKFTDVGVADFFDRMVDAGLQPTEFGRIWLHTHPGCSARPSAIDEMTFARVFAKASYSVMGIVAKAGETYARLQVNHGFTASLRIPVQVDYAAPFSGSDFAGWDEEYRRNVSIEEIRWPESSAVRGGEEFGDDDFFLLQDPWRDVNLTDLFGEVHRWEPIALPASLGVGAVGRQVAVQLACIGVRRLQLIDFDSVESTNVTTQGYRDAEVGVQKVDAAAQAVWEIDPGIAVEAISNRYRPSTALYSAVFVCVDKIESRASLWRAGGQRAEFLVDGRLLGETARVIAVGDSESREHYPRTLFTAAEAQQGSCGAQGAIYVAAVVSGIMLAQFARWLRGSKVDSDLSLNLTASELSPYES